MNKKQELIEQYEREQVYFNWGTKTEWK
jgi:hypothetical protein